MKRRLAVVFAAFAVVSAFAPAAASAGPIEDLRDALKKSTVPLCEAFDC